MDDCSCLLRSVILLLSSLRDRPQGLTQKVATACSKCFPIPKGIQVM